MDTGDLAKKIVDNLISQGILKESDAAVATWEVEKILLDNLEF